MRAIFIAAILLYFHFAVLVGSKGLPVEEVLAANVELSFEEVFICRSVRFPHRASLPFLNFFNLSARGSGDLFDGKNRLRSFPRI
jgi:hypothetical protein